MVTAVGDGGHIDEAGLDSLTDTQRAILDALQRPLREGGPYSTPATNKQIADEVHLSVDAVKGHLRALYARLGLEQLPQNAKRARLAEIGLSGAVDESLPPRPPDPAIVAATPAPSQRGRIPAMLSAVGLGLVLLGVVVGLMLGHDGGETIISQAPGADEPGNAGKGRGGKGTLLGGLPGPWSDDGLFAAGPAVPAGYELAPGTAGAAPVSKRAPAEIRERASAEIRRESGPDPGPRRPVGSAPPSQPAAPATAPAVTTTPTRRARRTCTTRRQVTYRPVTVTVRRVRLHPHTTRRRVVRYRTEVRMVPVTRQVTNDRGGNGKGKKNRNGKGGQGSTHPETVMVRQVRRVPVVRYVTRVRQHRHVRFVKVTKRQRSVRVVRSCR